MISLYYSFVPTYVLTASSKDLRLGSLVDKQISMSNVVDFLSQSLFGL